MGASAQQPRPHITTAGGLCSHSSPGSLPPNRSYLQTIPLLCGPSTPTVFFFFFFWKKSLPGVDVERGVLDRILHKLR